MALDDLFFISTAAEQLGMHPQTLRKYERLGLIRPSRTIGSMRLYAREELERLRLIKQTGGRARHQPGWSAAPAGHGRSDATDPAVAG